MSLTTRHPASARRPSRGYGTGISHGGIGVGWTIYLDLEKKSTIVGDDQYHYRFLSPQGVSIDGEIVKAKDKDKAHALTRARGYFFEAAKRFPSGQVALVRPHLYRVEDRLYSYQNPTVAAPITMVRLAESADDHNRYKLSIPDPNAPGYTRSSNWISEQSLSRTPIKGES